MYNVSINCKNKDFVYNWNNSLIDKTLQYMYIKTTTLTLE